MNCSNCGKNIPYDGKVCPYCNVDKSEDKFRSDAFHVGGTAGAFTGGWIGFRLYHHVGPAFAGMLVGIFTGFVGFYILRASFRAWLRDPKKRSSPRSLGSHKDWNLEDKK